VIKERVSWNPIFCVCMPPTGRRVRVTLEKSSSDLGFSLEGGVGSSSGDKPLTVKKIFRGKTTFSQFKTIIKNPIQNAIVFLPPPT